jgi:hypothetical protein
MKCFEAIEEDLLLEIWLLDPSLVVPFSRASVKASSLTKKPENKEIESQYLQTRKVDPTHINPKQAEGA